MKPENDTGNDVTTFIKHAAARLDQGEQQLDSTILRQLRLSRDAALNAQNQHNTWAVSAGLVSTAAVVVLTLSLWNMPIFQNHASSLLDDIELLSAADDLEFYQELEFYLWLDEKQHNS